jgi:hypothetical protein
MKPNQIDKLYSKLTPHEQAALCMEAALKAVYGFSRVTLSINSYGLRPLNIWDRT